MPGSDPEDKSAARSPTSNTRSAGQVIQEIATLIRSGNLDAAEHLCRQRLQHHPGDFEATSLLGMISAQRSNHLDALQYFEQALRAHPMSYEMRYNRAATLSTLRRFEDAVRAFDDTLAVNPNCVESLNNRGNALQALQRHAEALASYERALQIRPELVEALNNRGNALRVLRREEEALASFDRALHLQPNRAELHNHRGAVLQAKGRYAEALRSYDAALAIDPSYLEALNNRGGALQGLRRFAEALASYDRALALNASYADAIWNKSLLLLLTGDFARGWPLYEWRWRRTGAPAELARAQPLWRPGRGIAGKRILLTAEQGLGDTIQFSRYAKHVADKGAQVALEVLQPLVGILSRLEGVGRIVASGEDPGTYDLHSPLLSLPLLFDTRLDTIPASVPYLHARSDCAARWSQRLGPPRGLRIGVAWSGGALLENDRNRSIRVAQLHTLLSRPLDWICLQKEIRDYDREEMRGYATLREFSEALTDFEDTAALIEQCDLVIAVDTAVAHLAGALAKPVWLLLPALPDWRWMLEREDSPWYPTLRLFRQATTGDWSVPLERIALELDRLTSAQG